MPSRSPEVRHDHQPGVRPRRLQEDHPRPVGERPRPGTAGDRRWRHGSARPPSGCSDLASVTTGVRVLDVAAGAGGQTLAAARRVGPGGRVLATDISPAILAYAESEAREAGLGNVETREVDGEALDVEAGAFDAVVSRVGLIYFPDQHRGAGRDAAGAAARRPHRGGRLLHGRAQRLLLGPGRHHPPPRRPAAAAARPARPVQPRRPGVLERRSPMPGSTTSRCVTFRLPSACRRPRSACGSSGSRSAPSTRCSPGLDADARERPGARSGRAAGPVRGSATGSSAPCELLVAAGRRPV